MQKYYLKKSIRIIDIGDVCYLYDRDKFVEYKLNKEAANLVRQIINEEDIVDQDNLMMQLSDYEIILSEK